MMEHPTNPNDTEDARRRIANLLNARGEWFCSVLNDVRRGHRAVAPIALRKGEWEVSTSNASLLFSAWSEQGTLFWRVTGWEWSGEKLVLEATRRMGAERATLELVPRASASAALMALTAARLAAAERLSKLACALAGPGTQVERLGLSTGMRRGEPGRYARIVLQTRGASGGQRVTVTGPVADLRRHEVDSFLASALLWWFRICDKKTNSHPTPLWLIVTHQTAGAVGERLALLREALRRDIALYEVDEAHENLAPASTPELRWLLRTDTAARFKRPARVECSGLAERIVALDPEAVDVVRASHGETLRFRGLAFARVRRVGDGEHLWFGVDGARRRRLLDTSSWPQLLKLIDELSEHRRADATDARHALYKNAPEAWLESLLRRDITRLDPGLIISPLHAQFRTSQTDVSSGARPIDLLALRRDGRLVVIELKATEDITLPLQGADYWRRVETHRRAGSIARTKLFGDAVIADEPPLVYLVAPTLRFHRAFDTLAHAISTDIEMYRFDINEDWRAGVRVMRRVCANQSAPDPASGVF
ncbi:MAG: hypothetical protein M3458_04940 [Acidobacteriota bacterium]|nr:hypothetical protein [Acidobacteriota bacterium]